MYLLAMHVLYRSLLEQTLTLVGRVIKVLAICAIPLRVQFYESYDRKLYLTASTSVENHKGKLGRNH